MRMMKIRNHVHLWLSPNQFPGIGPQFGSPIIQNKTPYSTWSISLRRGSTPFRQVYDILQHNQSFHRRHSQVRSSASNAIFKRDRAKQSVNCVGWWSSAGTARRRRILCFEVLWAGSELERGRAPKMREISESRSDRSLFWEDTRPWVP